MKRFVALAMIVAGLVLPACAQRGGSSHGGFSSGHGGMASHGMASRGGFSAPSAARLSAAPGLRGARPLNRALSLSGTNSGHFSGGWNHPNRERHRRPYISPYGTGVPYLVAPWPGWLGSDYLGYPDDTGYNDAQPSQGAGQYGTPGQYMPAGPGSDDAPPWDQYEPAPRPAYQPAAHPAPVLPSEDAVTLVFKDGRPDEQIHNYILTRNALYVQDQDRRTIPLEQLDLVATTKVNQQSGADFQIPNPSR